MSQFIGLFMRYYLFLRSIYLQLGAVSWSQERCSKTAPAPPVTKPHGSGSAIASPGFVTDSH